MDIDTLALMNVILILLSLILAGLIPLAYQIGYGRGLDETIRIYRKINEETKDD